MEGLRTGHAGHEAAEVGYVDSHLLQNPLRGVAVRAPVGSVTDVSYGFRKGPTGTTEPSVENSGIYSPANDQVGIVAAGAEEVNVSATSVVVSHTLGIKDGEANPVTLNRAGSDAHTQTLQNATGTIALTSDIPAAYTDEQAQDAVGGMVDGSLTYVDATPLLQRAALTGDVTAAAGSNSTTIADDAVTNAKAANMAANTVKTNLTTSTASPTDAAAGDFSTEASPAAGDFLWLWTDEGGGVLQQKKVNWSALPSSGSSDLVFTATAADTDVSEVTDVTIVSRDVASVGATDKLIVEGEFTILNNSSVARSYTVTVDFDALFDIEITFTANASATNELPVFFKAVLDVRSTSLSYMQVLVQAYTAAAVAGGADTSVSSTTILHGAGWGTSTTDVTGTTTVTLKVRSSNANATQTLRLHNMTIRKVTPT